MDVVTDGFIKAFRNIQSLIISRDADTEKIVMGWLKKIMIHGAIDALRKKNMLPEIGRLDEAIWNLADPSEDAARLLLYADLMQLIRELPPNYRVVFNMHVLDGCAHAEIAEVLNISISTSRSSLSRARSLLQERIIQMEKGKQCRI